MRNDDSLSDEPVRKVLRAWRIIRLPWPEGGIKKAGSVMANNLSSREECIEYAKQKIESGEWLPDLQHFGCQQYEEVWYE